MFYKYYSNICVCSGTEFFLPMRTIEGGAIYNYPVIVYNVNGQALGLATNKEQYIMIWNSSNSNRQRGVLSGLPGPFSFSLKLRRNQVAPTFVIGDTCELIVDADGYFLTDADGNYVGGQCTVIPPIEPPIGGDGEFFTEFSSEFFTQTLL